MATQTNESSVRLRRAQERSSRRSALRAAIFLVLAVVAAAGTAVLLSQRYDEQMAEIKEAQVVTTMVVVADVDIPLGTVLSVELLKAVNWPEAAAPTGKFETVEDLVDRVVVTQIYKGEPVLASKLADPEAGSGLAAILPPGMLAVAVRVDDVVGVAGFIHPGDRVDIIVTMRPDDRADSVPTSKIIMQNMTVLTVGAQLNRADKKSASKPMPTTVATLMVTPEQAEGLALAATQGQLLLALRSALFDETVKTAGMVASELMPRILSKARTINRGGAKPTPPAAAAVTPVQPPPGDEVEILRGDRFEKRRFEDKKGKDKEKEKVTP